MSTSSLSRRSFVAGTAAAAAGVAALSQVTLGSVNEAKAAGGTITAACAYSSTNYSPIGCSSALMLGATWHVFEGLYELDVHDYTTYNALAADVPTKVSDTEYQVTLRDDAKYSDGTDVTTEDVVNAFELNMANDTYGAFLSFIDAVTAVDEKTVSITLKYAFDEGLIQGRLAVVKIFPASITPDDLAVSPIGSGPWAYAELNGDDGGYIDFVPNPYYNGAYPAQADAMHWDVIKDGTSRSVTIMGGTSMVMEAVPDANVEAIEGAGATVEYKDGFSLPFLMFNTKKAPFDDKRVRQAFFYAIDVEKLIANVMNGHANPVKSFLPESFANYHEASTVYTYDPEKAAELLAEAGYADGIDVELYCNNNWVSDLSIQIQNDLTAAGINTTLRTESINWAELGESDDILPYDVMLTPGDPSCFGADPDLLMSWWYGDNIWTSGRSCWNYTPEWAELQDLMQAAREAGGDEQQELWNQCFDLLSEEVPLYPLFHRQLATGYLADQIEGFEPIATTGLVFLGASVK
jgi:ABC-type transport system substrate-binding protein